MLHRIRRPADAPGPHHTTLHLAGGRFDFARDGRSHHDVELDPEADARLIVQLGYDGYKVINLDPEA